MTMPRAHERSGGVWVLWLVGLVLIAAPLIRGGNRPLPLLGLEVAALALVAWVVARPQRLAAVPKALLWALAGLFALPLAQLVPLPVEEMAALGVRATYVDALAGIGMEAGPAALSVVPQLTEGAWLALLPPLAVFLVVVGLRGSDVERLMLVFVAVACFQAVLALMQFGAGPDSVLRLGMEFHHRDSGVGTYPSRNNLAGLLEMALPIALALFAASIFRLDRDTRSDSRGRSSWWARFKGFGAAEGQTNRTLVYAVVCLVVLLGLVFSRSRMGIAMGMVGLVLTTLLLARNFGGRFSAHLVGVMSVVGMVLASTIGLAPVFARFAQDPMADGRWAFFEASWRAAQDFFPFGSGAGTYAEVIRAYHPAEFGGEAFINHAHNDYLQWVVEGGAPAMVLMLAFAAVYLLQWRKVWAVRNWQTLHMMQVGAGVGLFVLMLHGLTDYNLRIPANQIYFALLAAAFFHSGGGSMARSERRRRKGDVGTVSPDTGPLAGQALSSGGARTEIARAMPQTQRAHAAAPVAARDDATVEAWARAPVVPDDADEGRTDAALRAKRAVPPGGGDNPFAGG